MCATVYVCMYTLSYFKSGNNRKEFQYDFLFCKYTAQLKATRQQNKSENENIFEFRLFCVSASASSPSSSLSVFRVCSLQTKTFMNDKTPYVGIAEKQSKLYRNRVEFPNEVRLRNDFTNHRFWIWILYHLFNDSFVLVLLKSREFHLISPFSDDHLFRCLLK